MTTILEVIEKGAGFLKDKGIEDARLTMELLVAHELKCERMDLYLRFDHQLPERTLSQLRKNIKKRSQRIPIQYIIGYSHFRNHRFKTDPRALIPRPETEELVELILGKEFQRPARILDMGCGTGAIGISLALELGIDCEKVFLADLSTDALSLCESNCRDLEVDAEVIHSDLFSKINGSFDIIVANLPYVAEHDRGEIRPEVLQEPESALFSGEDGLDLIRRFCREASKHLNPRGLVALEVGYNQGETVCNLLRSKGFQEVELHQDLAGIPRFPLARCASIPH